MLVISLIIIPVVAFAHGGGLNALGCHNNKKTGGYHCHQGSDSPSSLGLLKSSMNEDFYNMALARKLDGETEVTFEYEYGLKGNTPLTASIRIDIVTDEYTCWWR
ncbi:YHYH domain-containing protein [Candidatus Puniceispirillum sp.]|nr:YHYH domain-containing protein [Candidatus Puniceispirillum sp.]